MKDICIGGMVLFIIVGVVGIFGMMQRVEPAKIITIEANVSAYCPCEKCCGKFADGITAFGYVIQKGNKFCAAPKEYPFGTIIDIPGYGIVPVMDRGGAIAGNKFDVYFDTHQEAKNWGRQSLEIKIKLKE